MSQRRAAFVSRDSWGMHAPWHGPFAFPECQSEVRSRRPPRALYSSPAPMAPFSPMVEVRAAMAELLATALLTFFGAGSASGAQLATSGGTIEVRAHRPGSIPHLLFTRALALLPARPQPVNYAIGFGFVVTALAFSIGSVSGAHMNSTKRRDAATRGRHVARVPAAAILPLRERAATPRRTAAYPMSLIGRAPQATCTIWDVNSHLLHGLH